MSGFSELSWVSKGDQGILTIQDIGLTVQCADTNLILLISYSISPSPFSNILQQGFSISALLMCRDQIILHCLDHPVNCRILAASLTFTHWTSVSPSSQIPSLGQKNVLWEANWTSLRTTILKETSYSNTKYKCPFFFFFPSMCLCLGGRLAESVMVILWGVDLGIQPYI